MEKIRSFNLNKILSYLKSALIGIATTLIFFVIFAVVLKFVDVPSGVVGYVNDIIKVLSIFLMMFFMKRFNDGKFIIKGAICGLIYGILTYVIFSIINGDFMFDMSLVFDLLFAVVVGVISAVILNLMSHKNA